MVTMAISLISLWLLVIGLGILLIGIPPGARGSRREFSVCWGDDHLCDHMAGTCDVVFHRVSFGRNGGSGYAGTLAVHHNASGRCSRLMWLLVLKSDTVTTPPIRAILRSDSGARNGDGRANLGEIVGVDLFAETVWSLLDQPMLASSGWLFAASFKGQCSARHCRSAEHMIAWPQTVGMIARAIMLFVIGYVIFQRQEVRA